MKIGIIGFGGIGKQHFRALNALESVEAIHIYTPRMKPLEQEFSAANFHSSLQELLDSVDGVVIASPNQFHMEHILAASKKNKFILCEKPLCCNLEEMNIIKENIKNDSMFNISFNYRFLNIVKSAKQFINFVGVDKIQSIALKFNKDSAFTKKNFTWRESGTSGQSSGAFGDLGIHLIDMVVYLLNSIPIKNKSKVSLKTHLTHRGSEKIMVDDTSSFIGTLENHINFEIYTSKACAEWEKGFAITIVSKNSQFHYHSSEANAYMIDLEGKKNKQLLEIPQQNGPASEVYGWADSFFEQDRAWIDKIKMGKENKTLGSFNDGLIAQRIFSESTTN